MLVALVPLILAANLCLQDQPGGGADPAPDAQDAARAAAWIKEHAIPLQTPVAGNGFDDLAPLKGVIGDAHIVSLGEPTHGTREAFQLKHRLVEYLVEELGFSIFSIEASMPESFALNQYVIDGKGDPASLIAGMYFWTWRTEEVLAMVEWMREWNRLNRLREKPRPTLQFTGFDMQTPDVAAKIVHDYLATDADADVRVRYDTLAAKVKQLTKRASLGSTKSGYTSATASFPVEIARGKKLNFSCWIRTENAGRAGAWWRCDTPNGVNGFNNMADEMITGTSDWARYEFTIDVPQEAENIAFGFLLSGGNSGAVWYDDVEIMLDGVRYEDPKLFSLDFENDEVKFLSPVGGNYSVARVEANPHAGKKCLEIRHLGGDDLDGAAIAAQAQEFVDRIEKAALHDGKTGEQRVRWAIQNARVVAQCARMYGGDNGFNVRDESMAANVRWILKENPGAKIVLWAHNGHVSRGGYMDMRSMGSFLHETHADDMVVFGFTTGRGLYTAQATGVGLKSDNELGPIPEGSVEWHLGLAGIPNLLLDIRPAKRDDPASAWAATSRKMRSIGALATRQQFFTCNPRRMFDVLVWQERTTAARTLPW